MNPSSSFTHPAHRSIRSPWPKTAVLGRLTDSRIDHYSRLGYYGSARRAAILQADAERTARKARRSAPKTNISDAMKLLSALLD